MFMLNMPPTKLKKALSSGTTSTKFGLWSAAFEEEGLVLARTVAAGADSEVNLQDSHVATIRIVATASLMTALQAEVAIINGERDALCVVLRTASPTTTQWRNETQPSVPSP